MPTLAELNADLEDREAWLQAMRDLPDTYPDKEKHVSVAEESVEFARVAKESHELRIAQGREQA